MVFTRMFFIQPAAASCTRSSSEPVNVSKVCRKQREEMPMLHIEHVYLHIAKRPIKHKICNWTTDAIRNYVISRKCFRLIAETFAFQGGILEIALPSARRVGESKSSCMGHVTVFPVRMRSLALLPRQKSVWGCQQEERPLMRRTSHSCLVRCT